MRIKRRTYKRNEGMERQHTQGGSNRRHEFLRLNAEQLVGNRTNGILYRLLKSGLRSLGMSRDVKIVDFDAEPSVIDNDIDSVLMERMQMYIKYRTRGTTDDHWGNIIEKTLSDRVGIRFEENDKRYYIFPTCIFVSDRTTTVVGREANTDTPVAGTTTDFHAKHKYQHSEDEANALLDERQKEQVRSKRETVNVEFMGFTIQMNDGQQDATVDVRVKRSGGTAVDNNTFFRYLKLSQSGVKTTDHLVQDTSLGKGMDMNARCDGVVKLLKGQLKTLLQSRSTTSVRVDIGDPKSTNSAHFTINFDYSKQRTAYKETTHDQMHHRGFYQAHGDDQKEHFDLEATIDRKVHDDDIKSYLTERADLSREKRIIMRYYNVQDEEDQYIVYTFQVANAACKLAGDTIHLVTRSLEPNISEPDIQMYSLRDSSCKYWLHADVATTDTSAMGEAFDPNIVVPIFKIPIEDTGDSSMEEVVTEEDERSMSSTKKMQHSDDHIVKAYTAIANASSVLQFFARLVFEVVQESGSSWSSPTTMKAGVDGVYRSQFATSSFPAGREDHNEPFRMNSDYMFMHLLLCASHHLKCVSYTRMVSKSRMIGKKQTNELAFLVVAGAESIRGAGNQIFHDKPSISAEQKFATPFIDIFCKSLSSSSMMSGSKSFASNQDSMVTTNHVLENIRLFYKEKLGSLSFHLQERDDPDEFFLCLERRNFWPLYAKRIQVIHGPFYKDVVHKKDHDYFLRRLFYYQLRNVVFPTRSTESTAPNQTNEMDPTLLIKRIPTYHTDQPEFSELVSDAHRTLLNLRSLRYEPPAHQGAYSINVLEQYGAHQKMTTSINLATSRNRTATDDMLEKVKDGDTKALNDHIREMMRSYNITDTTFIAELQRKNTRLLFHFLHMVENNGSLDTLGNLHVTYRDVRDLKAVLREALRIQSNESGGNIFTKKSFFSGSLMSGTPLAKVGERLFSLEPFLTIHPLLLKKIHRKNGLRYMLQDWSQHGNLFWNIMSFKSSSALFSSRFEKLPVRAFKLYVFLPSHIYLTREIRNLIPHLEKNGRATIEAIIKTQEAMQDKHTSKLYNTEGVDSVVRGLLFGIQQELLHTSETNLYIMCMTDKKDKDTYWLFGHWQRQYVLYEMGGNTVKTDNGLKQLMIDPTLLAHEKRIANLLDEKVYESSEEMLSAVRRWRQEVETKTEQRTTVKTQANVRASHKRRRSSMRKKMDVYGKINDKSTIAHLQAADKMSQVVMTRKEKVYTLVQILQKLAFRPSVLPTANASVEKLFNSEPYQNNPMCATMWLIFRELYTFMPSMYNHIMTTMNDRLRYAELGLALNSGGLLAGGVLVPRKEPMALADKGFQYYVGTNEQRKDRKERRNFLLYVDKVHENTVHARIHRRNFFQMVIENLAQLGAVQDSTMSYHETEHAEVKVMSWLKYVAHEDVGKRVGKNKFLVVSALLNGILATNAIMGNPVLRMAFRLVNPSGVVSTVASPMLMIAKMMLPVLWTPALATFAIGATMGVSGTFSAMASTAGLLNQGYQQGADGGVMSGVTSALQKALFGVARGVKGGAKKSASSVTNKVMDSLSHYLVTNIYMYRIKVRFLHNGHKYVWKFDMGVDRATNRVLMYHGMRDGAQQEVTAYRDIKPESDDDLRKIREHKKSQKKRRRSSTRKRTAHEDRNYHTRDKKNRMDVFRRQMRASRKRRY